MDVCIMRSNRCCHTDNRLSSDKSLGAHYTSDSAACRIHTYSKYVLSHYGKFTVPPPVNVLVPVILKSRLLADKVRLASVLSVKLPVA